MAVNTYGAVHSYLMGMGIPTHFARLAPPRPCLNPHHPYMNSRGVHSQFRQIASIQRWPNQNQLIQNVNAPTSSPSETKPPESNNMRYKEKQHSEAPVPGSMSDNSTMANSVKVKIVRKGTI